MDGGLGPHRKGNLAPASSTLAESKQQSVMANNRLAAKSSSPFSLARGYVAVERGSTRLEAQDVAHKCVKGMELGPPSQGFGDLHANFPLDISTDWYIPSQNE